MNEDKSANPSTTDTVTAAFACTVCGCVCDDLRITVADGRIRHASRACGLAEPWLLSQGTLTLTQSASEDRDEPALAEVDGQHVSLEQAVERAAEILRTARAPLIFGLTKCGTDGQRAAIALADRIGGCIDTPASSLPLTLAMQEVGWSTCTLGEVRQRADLVIFWGADPVVTHPRLLERILHDRSRPTLLVADVQRTASAEVADRFVPLQDGRQLETIWSLRGLVREPSIALATNNYPAQCDDTVKDHQAERDEYIAELLKRCRFGVVFFGRGLSEEGPRTVEALLRLVAELNDRTRFYALSLLGIGAGGADNVLAWQTGYPGSVNLAHGYPRSNPGEFSAEKMLENAEVDACLLIGSDAAAHLSSPARAHLGRLPTIALDGPGTSSSHPANVRITTAIPGIHTSGTVYRLDGVAIPLKGVLAEGYPRTAAVLQSISARL